MHRDRQPKQNKSLKKRAAVIYSYRKMLNKTTRGLTGLRVVFHLKISPRKTAKPDFERGNLRLMFGISPFPQEKCE